MSDFPGRGPQPLLVSTWSAHLSPMGQLLTIAGTAPVSFNWTANLAVYVPIWLPWPYPVARVWWVNGNTATANANFGIFAPSGKRVYSTGSTAQSGANAIQYVTPSPAFTLPPGPYYFAWACDNTSSRAFGLGVTVLRQQQVGVLQQASNLALADPAVFATPSANAYPLCGITQVGASMPF